MKKLLGVKQEMTQVFTAEGQVVPVTVIDVSGNALVEQAGLQNRILLVRGKKKKATKAALGKFKALGYAPEISLEVEVDTDTKPGEVEFTEDLTGKSVNVTGTTKGKGFQGVVKRWGFAGGKVTHGQSDRMRAPGSIGSGTTPGRVLKGKKMGGHMGMHKKTIANLEIVKHLQAEKLLLVKGAIPGPKGANVVITIK